MKRKLATAIFGIGASMAIAISAHAQGSVTFENYGFSTFAPVTYTPGGPGVDSTFTAGLWYFLGTTTLATGTGADVLPAGWELAPITQQFNVGAEAGPNGAGMFIGGNAIIADYTSGPITFAVTAYNGTSYDNSQVRAHSAGFTLPQIATGTASVGEFGPGLTSFAVSVPEPSIFAFSGLSAAALLLIRRGRVT